VMQRGCVPPTREEVRVRTGLFGCVVAAVS
jgi:hypothetical protein